MIMFIILDRYFFVVDINISFCFFRLSTKFLRFLNDVKDSFRSLRVDIQVRVSFFLFCGWLSSTVVDGCLTFPGSVWWTHALFKMKVMLVILKGAVLSFCSRPFAQQSCLKRTFRSSQSSTGSVGLRVIADIVQCYTVQASAPFWSMFSWKILIDYSHYEIKKGRKQEYQPHPPPYPPSVPILHLPFSPCPPWPPLKSLTMLSRKCVIFKIPQI